MTEYVDMFATLFAGRTDAHGSWTGGKLDGYPDYEAHLHDGPYIGVYCVDDDNMCHWGCVDIDGKDFPRHGSESDKSAPHDWDAMWDVANNLTEALKYKNITAWTERTTNGIHIWTFPTEPVPATIMRRALLVACDVIDYQPKEVNPKQETLNPDKPYGNYVRLCYPRGNNNVVTQEESDEAFEASSERLLQELVARESGMAGGTAGGGGQLSHNERQGQESEVRDSFADVRQGRGGTSKERGWCWRCRNTWGPNEALSRQELEEHLLVAGSGDTGSNSLSASYSSVHGREAFTNNPRWPERSVIAGGGPICVTCFVEQAYENRTEPKHYKDVAEYYIPPVHHDVNVDVEATSKFKLLYPALPPVVQMIYEQGPLGDRSSALMKTAVILRDNGWQAQAAYDVLDNMDLRLGKFVGREDREMRLLQMIEDVY